MPINERINAEIAKVTPAVTAGKGEAPRRILILTLARELDDQLAAALNASETHRSLKARSIDAADVGLTALTLKATMRGIARGEKQGTVSMILFGVVAKCSAGEEEEPPSVKLIFNLDYVSSLAVFLIENLKSVVEVHLQTLQEDLPGTAEVEAGDDPTEPQDPPKPKRGRKAKNGAAEPTPPEAA